MRIVILGGTGFIGSALAANLAARGDTVIVPTRSANRQVLAGAPSHAILYETGDIQNPDQLVRIITGADAVVNLVGENIAGKRWTAAQKQRIVSSRVRMGEVLCSAFASLSSPPKTLIQASAVGFYGAWPEMTSAPTCTEQSPPGNHFLADTALRWEASTAEIEQSGTVRRCIIRTAPVLGAGGGMLAPLLPVFRFGLGGIVGSGRQPFAWIHLHDEVNAIRFLLDTKHLSGAFNLAAPSHSSAKDFAKALGRALHRPVLLPIPAFALRLALGEMAEELLLTGQRVVPENLLRVGFNFMYTSLDAALHQIVGQCSHV